MTYAILYRGCLHDIGDEYGDLIVGRFSGNKYPNQVGFSKAIGRKVGCEIRPATAADIAEVEEAAQQRQQRIADAAAFDAREDVILARQIAELCNGDVMPGSPILRLGLLRLRRMCELAKK